MSPGRGAVTFQWRANPGFVRLRDLCAGGELGELVHADLEFRHNFLAGPETSWPWRHRRKSAGSGSGAVTRRCCSTRCPPGGSGQRPLTPRPHWKRAWRSSTPELVARDPDLLDAYRRAGVPLIGDDLASHFGTSVVHRALLGLLSDRGLTLASSYQLNFGGNEDFRNLGEQGASKRQCGTVVARAQLCSPTSSSSCRALFQSCVRFPGRAGNSLAPRPPALWQARQPVDPGNDTNGVSSSVK